MLTHLRLHKLFSLILLLGLSLPSAFSQTEPPDASAPTQESAPATGEKKAVTEGIRFVFKENPGNNASIFMPISKAKAVKIAINKGVPGERYPFPPGKKLFFFDSNPIDKKAQPNKLGEAEIPATMGPKILCIVHPTSTGLKCEFVDEAMFKELGTIFIRNLTTIDLGLRVFDHKNKPKEDIQLASGKETKFAPGRVAPGTPNASNIYPTQLCRKDEKGNWYVMRQIALEVPYFGWQILLFNWNELNNMPEVQSIVIRPDRTQTNPRGASRNNRPAPGRTVTPSGQ